MQLISIIRSTTVIANFLFVHHWKINFCGIVLEKGGIVINPPSPRFNVAGSALNHSTTASN